MTGVFVLLSTTEQIELNSERSFLAFAVSLVIPVESRLAIFWPSVCYA